jgi:hypothetical protein
VLQQSENQVQMLRMAFAILRSALPIARVIGFT